MKGNELSRRNFIKFGIAGGAAAMTGAASRQKTSRSTNRTT